MTGDDFDERILEKGRECYEAGDKLQLLYCLNHCVTNDLPIPDWLKQAFQTACSDVHAYKVKSWDDVFGKPLQNKQLKVQRRNMEIAWPIYRLVRQRHEAGEPIDEYLFEQVAGEINETLAKDEQVKKTTVSEIYYSLLREFTEGDDE